MTDRNATALNFLADAHPQTVEAGIEVVRRYPSMVDTWEAQPTAEGDAVSLVIDWLFHQRWQRASNSALPHGMERLWFDALVPLLPEDLGVRWTMQHSVATLAYDFPIPCVGQWKECPQPLLVGVAEVHVDWADALMAKGMRLPPDTPWSLLHTLILDPPDRSGSPSAMLQALRERWNAALRAGARPQEEASMVFESGCGTVAHQCISLMCSQIETCHPAYVAWTLWAIEAGLSRQAKAAQYPVEQGMDVDAYARFRFQQEPDVGAMLQMLQSLDHQASLGNTLRASDDEGQGSGRRRL